MAVAILFGVSLVINLPFAFGAAMVPDKGGNTDDRNDSVNGTLVQSFVTSDLDETIVYCNSSLDSKRFCKGFSENNFNHSDSVEGSKHKMICGANPDSFYFKHEKVFHNWFMDFGLLFSAPVSILTVCNIIILVTVCRHKRNPALRDSTRFNGRGSSALTARVVMLSVVQCISVGPFSIASLIPGALPDNKAVDMVFYDRLFTVTVMIWYLNNCVNFILYNVFGQAFRRDCTGLFRRIFRCHQRKQPMVIVRHSKEATGTTSL